MHDSTASLLAAHRPADALEREHHARMVTLLESAKTPFSRAHFDPGHFTASAFVLTEDRERVLLIWHRKLQRWLQPGGHIETDDGDPIAAARREVTEETGLTELVLVGTGLLDADVHLIPAHGDEPEHSHFDLRFCFATTQRDAVAGDGVSAVRWVPLAELTTLQTDDSVRRAAQRCVELARSAGL